MAAGREEIIVDVRVRDKLSKGLRTVRERINQFGQTTNTVSKQYKRLSDGSNKVVKNMTRSTRVVQSARMAQASFSDVLGMNLTQWRKYNMLGGKFKTVGGRAANTFRTMTHGLRGFRMEMLGVMFFGMGLSKFFTGLLRPAMELVGVFKIWTNLLAMAFLPIALMLLPLLLKFMDWFLNIPEPVRVAIGVFIALVAIFFQMVFLIGMFALGLGSMIQAFGGMAAVGAIFSKIMAGIAALLSGPVLLALLGIIALVAALVIAWKQNFGEIQTWFKDVFWGNLKLYIEDFKKFWKGFLEIIIGLFRQNNEQMKSGFKNMVDAWIDSLKPTLGIITSLFVTMGLAVFRGVIGVGKFMFENIFGWLEYQVNQMISIINFLIRQINKLLEIEFVSKIAKKLGIEIIPEIEKWTRPPSKWPGLQLGGFVPHTGLRMLHAGETVLPAGANTINFTPNITVNATSNVDIDMLKSQLSEQLRDEVDNLNRR